ncbi:MAG: KaiC domain-containing protein [Candidatus Terraquivivens tikiterensis]|uniref:KaiC domain-containing protein n=1 Tax=Candidatus Terraquivivens tikiterensis TaxID=1980982 RepID=A0A2R7Y0Y1_9ARCH|nr:MAG: KaiC domain-containing protein [Candidatus Terraquivivens tikiterensis]
MASEVKRLRTGVEGIDELLEGGIPEEFLVAVTGEPGCGKTIFSIHFINQGVIEGDKCIYVTTEESRESIVKQAAQFGMDFSGAIAEGKLIVIDALMGKDDRWSLQGLDLEALVGKIIEAKKELGYGRARVAIDSLSAFWLDKPAMARRYSYFVKKVLSKWNFTILAVSQYAITTAESFGWGIEHIADGIIRFRRLLKGGELRRFVIVEKMRQTNHSRYLHEVDIKPGVGMVVLGRVDRRAEDYKLPPDVVKKILEAKRRSEGVL